MNQVEFGKLLLQEDEYRNKEWKTVSLLDTIRFGTFVWKRQMNFYRRLYNFFNQFEYEPPATETLTEFLKKREGHQLTFEKDSEQKASPLQDIKKTQTGGIGGSVNSGSGGLSLSNNNESKMPARDLTIEWIIRSKLEEDLKSWELNMESDYIKEKKRGQWIPCIINHIVTANVPDDEPEKMATSKSGQTVTVNVGSSVDPPSLSGSLLDSAKGKANLSRKNTTERKSSIQGPVLYKVLPLEVESKGQITAKADSVGFKDKPDRAHGNFSSVNTEPTLKESFEKLEKLIQPVLDNQPAVDAFNAISVEDIHYLYLTFREMDDLPEDFLLSDCKSQPCRDILLFAKFQPHESSEKLILKEIFKEDAAVIACHYLVALLAEVDAATTELLKKSNVNLFPLLKMVLLGESLDEVAVADVLKCQDAMTLLTMLDIQVKESSVDAISVSKEMVAKIVWLAMLYGAPAHVKQQ